MPPARRCRLPRDVQEGLADAKREGHRTVLLQIERDGKSRYVAVPFTG